MSLILYILLGIGIVIYQILRRKRMTLDFLTVFLFFFSLYYVLPGVVYNWIHMYGGAAEYPYPTYNNPNLLTPIVIILFFISAMLGFNVNLHNRIRWAPVIVGEKSFYLQYSFLFVCVCIAFLGLFLNAMGFGGFMAMIRGTWEFRHTTAEDAGMANMTQSGGFLIAIGRRLLPWINIAGVVAFGYFLYSRSGSKKALLVLLLGFALFVYFINVLSILSRGLVLTTVFVFMIVYFNYIKRLSIKWVTIFGGFGLWFLLFGKIVFKSAASLEHGLGAFLDSLSTGLASLTFESQLEQFIQITANFSHRIASTQTAIVNVGSDLSAIRHFQDFYNTFYAWVAPFIGRSQPLAITDINTLYMVGSLYTQIPPGVVALSFYSLWWIGPIFYGFLYGYFANVTEEILLRNFYRHPWMPGLYAYFAMYFGFGMLGLEPRSFFNMIFTLLPFLLGYRFLVHVRPTYAALR